MRTQPSLASTHEGADSFADAADAAHVVALHAPQANPIVHLVSGATTAGFRDRIAMLPRGARILVGMSGGVDSSVAAALLVEQGFDAVGISLHLWEYGAGASSPSRCCAPEDLDDARKSASTLGIPHFTFDRQAAFAQRVVDPFVDAYLDGATPSPCVACNRDVKVAAFVALAARLGAVAFATGHYARSGLIDARPAHLRALADHTDQSYFLHGIGVEALSSLVTPLGLLTKDQVRAIGRRHGLHNADKKDSEDLCFTEGDHASFVEARAGDRIRPGAIVDSEGRVVGQHKGIHRFTIGQRKGLGVAVGKKTFVARIDNATASVHLGDHGDLDESVAIVTRVQWLDDTALQDGPRKVVARIRSRHEGAEAVIARCRADDARDLGDFSDTGRVRVTFKSPTRAITPGQTCVFYDGDRVLGGGTIVR
ncbi:MAG: tRNA 2-thiouridine(34) synthase MnmA [Polyangiales bacterium]